MKSQVITRGNNGTNSIQIFRAHSCFLEDDPFPFSTTHQHFCGAIFMTKRQYSPFDMAYAEHVDVPNGMNTFEFNDPWYKAPSGKTGGFSMLQTKSLSDEHHLRLPSCSPFQSGGLWQIFFTLIEQP